MDKRLETIANMLPKGKIVADIGTDHGYLPIFLMQKKWAKKVYACDNKQGPLNQAIEHIQKEGLEESIIPLLSDGFQKVPLDANCAVLAGMGYFTARDILLEAKERLSDFDYLLVQINQDVPKLRELISEEGWRILDEEIAYDNHKYYICIGFTSQKGPKLKEEEILLGPSLIDKKSLLFKEYCRYQWEKLDGILKKQKDPIKQKETKQLMKSYEKYKK
ncbi:MAG: SAM-dependent methyltransferase [Solobacterium sp.]|nr:SAM-dependent methyltransferase [Solobacterium sp.]